MLVSGSMGNIVYDRLLNPIDRNILAVIIIITNG